MPTLSGPVEKVNYSFPVDDHKKINKPFQWVSGNSGGQILEPTYQNNFPISWYSLRQPALLGSRLGGRFDQWRYDYWYFVAFTLKTSFREYRAKYPARYKGRPRRGDHCQNVGDNSPPQLTPPPTPISRSLLRKQGSSFSAKFRENNLGVVHRRGLTYFSLKIAKLCFWYKWFSQRRLYWVCWYTKSWILKLFNLQIVCEFIITQCGAIRCMDNISTNLPK